MLSSRETTYTPREVRKFTRAAVKSAAAQWEALHNSELVTISKVKDDKVVNVWLRAMVEETKDWIKKGEISPEDLVFVLSSTACQIQEEICG